MRIAKGWLELVLISCALAFVVMAPSAVRAQVATGTMSGSVTDPSGAAIPGAKVTLTDTATGVSRDVVTNSAGYYNAPDLQPGPYQVTSSKDGFQTKVESGITLAVGAQQTLNIALAVGQVTQKVTVTVAQPQIELTSSTLTSQVEGPTIRELPLNGRDWTSLATLEPGVVSLAGTQYGYTQNGQNRTARGYGAQLTIAGSISNANVYRVDGIVVNDYANGVPGDALGVSLGVDAIEEFNVLTRNYSAAYGRSTGGVINAITRSGSNQLHGTVYEFLRNSAVDARNYFDPPAIPPLRRNQFGLSLGGPVLKNKTFLFGDYEGLRQFIGQTNIATVPSDSARAGNLCSIPTGVTPNCKPNTITVNSLVQPYLGMWGHVNDGFLGNGDTGQFRFVSDQSIDGNYGIIRADQQFSTNDSLNASYVDDTSTFTQPDNLEDVQVLQTTANKRIVIAETHVFSSTLVNAARIGFNRVNAFGGGGTSAINPLAGEASLGIPGIADASAIPEGGQADAPSISATGITGFLGGLTDQPYNTFFWNSYQAYDDVNWSRGKHTMQFGFGIEYDQDAKVTYVSGAGGFSYPSLTALLTNAAPNSFSVTFVPPSPTRHYSVWVPGGYFTDNYRVTKNLTANLGMRYEFATVPAEKNGLWSLLPSVSSNTPNLGGPPFKNNSLRNFEPRLGLVWDPFGDGKTSVRSGFGIFDSEILPYQFSALAAQSYPYSLRITNSKITSSASAPAFPDGALAQTLGSGGTSSLLTNTTFPRTGYYMQPNPGRSYVMQWNLSVQREILPNTTVMAAYVGSRGIHLEDLYYDANMVMPSPTSAGYLWPDPIGSGTKLNPYAYYGQIFYEKWGNEASYNGLITQVQHTLSHGFEIQGSYSWSKTFDNCSCSISSSSFLNSLQNNFFFYDPRTVADYDMRNNLTVNAIWTLPNPPKVENASVARVETFVLGGWQPGGIFNWRSGLPFTVGVAGDPLGTRAATIPPDFLSRVSGPGCGKGVNPGNVTDYINMNCLTLPMSTPSIGANCVPFPAATQPGTCENLLGNTGRNSLIGPGLNDIDFSLFKNQKITERINAQFRMETFNLFNHPAFTSPGLSGGGAISLYSATGLPVAGANTITSTADQSRLIQFALKFIW